MSSPTPKKDHDGSPSTAATAAAAAGSGSSDADWAAKAAELKEKLLARRKHTSASKALTTAAEPASTTALISPSPAMLQLQPKEQQASSTIAASSHSNNKAVLVADQNNDDSLKKPVGTPIALTRTFKLPVHTGPATQPHEPPVYSPLNPISQENRPLCSTYAPADAGQAPPSKSASQPAPKPAPAAARVAKAAIQDAASYYRSTSRDTQHLTSSVSDVNREFDRSGRPRSPPPSHSERRPKVEHPVKEGRGVYEYALRGGDGYESKTIASTVAMPPPRKAHRPSQATYDSYRPSTHGSQNTPRDRHAITTAQDRDLQDWLEYTGWNDEDYRMRFLDRQRRLAEIDRERAALLEADQREAPTWRDGGTNPPRPPVFYEPCGAGAPRELFGPPPSGSKREHSSDHDDAHPRKFARIDAAGSTRRISYRSPPHGGHEPRARQYWRRSDMFGDRHNPDEQTARAPRPAMVTPPWFQRAPSPRVEPDRRRDFNPRDEFGRGRGRGRGRGHVRSHSEHAARSRHY